MALARIASIQRSALAILVAAGFGLLVGGISSSFHNTHAEQIQVAANLGTGSLVISDAPCSIDPSGTQTPYDTTNNILDINVLSGSIASNCLGINATTTNPNGYTLTIDGPDSGNLTLADQTITPTAGTMETPTTFTTASDSSSWGFAVPSNQLQGTTLTGGALANGFDSSYSIFAPSNTTNTANYASVPATPTAISRTEAANAATDHYDFFFAASAGENVPTGTYTGVVTISGYGNIATPPPDIQTFTADNCPTTRTMVRDARDDHTYWIRKIPNTRSLGGSGDLCWMETNLAYAGGTSNGGTDAYGDVINDLVEGSTANNNIALGQPCYGDNTTMNASKTKCYWIPTGANPTVGVQTPSESTDGGATNPQYSYLYSWCAAMNGQTAACSTSGSSQPNQSANPGNGTVYNICPAGWRLPTGGTGGEFAKLATALGWTSGGPQSSLFANGLYMYSGVWNYGSFFNQGSYGYYWSSTVSSTTGAHYLYFISSSVSPANSYYEGYGRAVRCVADPAPPVLTTEAPTGAYMQEIVGNQTAVTDRIKYHCPTTRTRVRDARDDHTYWIRRIENTNALGDGQGTGSAMCWMETNLAYAGGVSGVGVSVYGDVVPTGTTNTTLNVITADTLTSTEPCYSDFDRPCVYTGTGRGGQQPTSGTTDPSLNGTGGYHNGSFDSDSQLGYLYNWCAAMNGTNPDQYKLICNNTDGAIMPEQAINPGNGTVYNICPAGWRLPYIPDASVDEFYKLHDALGAGTNVPDPASVLFANGLYGFTHDWSKGKYLGFIDSSYWYSGRRTAFGSDAAVTWITSPLIFDNTISSRANGSTVRCVAP